MCSSSCHGPKGAASTLARIGFGVTLLLMGVAHYLKLDSFTSLMSEGLATTPLAFLAPVMAYVLPALMIIGGFLYTIGFFMTVGAWVTGIALAAFPILMILKAVVAPDIEPTSVMPFVVYGIAWLVLFKMVTKSGCGHKGCATGCACGMPGCNCAPGHCHCGDKKVVAPMASSAPAKAFSPAKTVTKAPMSAPKKVPGKKA